MVNIPPTTIQAKNEIEVNQKNHTNRLFLKVCPILHQQAWNIQGADTIKDPLHHHIAVHRQDLLTQIIQLLIVIAIYNWPKMLVNGANQFLVKTIIQKIRPNGGGIRELVFLRF